MTATPTHVPLATFTTSSSTATITISNIPNTYRDLFLVFEGKANEANNRGFFVRFNGDATSGNYAFIYMNASDVFTSGAGTDSGVIGLVTDGGQKTLTQMHIMDYSQTQTRKSILVRTSILGVTYEKSWMSAEQWNSTAAINSITITASVSTLAVGAQVSLYGIAG